MGDQAAAVRNLLEAVVHSIFLALDSALIDDEPLPEEVRKRFRKARVRIANSRKQPPP